MTCRVGWAVLIVSLVRIAQGEKERHWFKTAFRGRTLKRMRSSRAAASAMTSSETSPFSTVENVKTVLVLGIGRQ